MSAALTTYDLFQKVVTCSFATNAAFKQNGTPAYLEGVVTAALAYLEVEHPLVFGGWSVVWGPQVWQAPNSTAADQTMAVLQSGDGSTYVVTIAGTQEASIYDQITEDLNVLPYQQVAWPNQTNAKVSAGTWQGLQNLLSMSNKNGVTLAQFLAGKANSGKSIIFAGHSLGGALAPALAFYLYPTGTANSGWQNVWTMPTAGPSTGNTAWFSAFATNFPKTPVGGDTNPWAAWNCNVVNTIDVVPKAWTQLASIPTLYTGVSGDAAASLTALSGLLQSMAADASGNAYGSFNNVTTFTGTQQNTAITTFTQAATEALYQHTTSYVNYFGIGGLLPQQSSTMVAPGVLSLIGA